MQARVLRQALGSAALLLVSVLLSLALAEAAYRLYRYATLENELVALLLRAGAEAGHSVYDADSGYRYVPNREWSDPARLVAWRTNEHGLIANDLDPSPYPVAKPANEYRIMVLGDSFTASNASRVRWSDILQQELNASEAWRRHAGGRFTRVLNGGMDGTGIVQWPAMFKHIARPFDPDLVIASYITDDVLRRFIRRGGDPSRKEQVARERARAMMGGVDWSALRHSELIADTLGVPLGLDNRLGLHPRYSAAAVQPNDALLRYASQSEGIAASLAAMVELKAQHPRVLLMQIPLTQELAVPEDNHLRWPRSSPLFKLDTRFRYEAAQLGLQIVNLSHANPMTAAQLGAMYKLPADAHFSDAGVRIYAGWLARYLIGQAEFWSGSRGAAVAGSG